MTELTEYQKIAIEAKRAFETCDECAWCEEKFIPDEDTIESANENGIDIIFCSSDCEWKFEENESTMRDLFSDDEGY